MKKNQDYDEIMAIIRVNDTTRIVLKNKELITKELSTNIVKKMCLFYGSSLVGRINGTKEMIGVSYKCPIIVSETNQIIAFPTTSYKNNDCNWFFLNYIDKYYYNKQQQLEIIFKNGQFINLNLSLGVFDKQILRASRLQGVLNARK